MDCVVAVDRVKLKRHTVATHSYKIATAKP